MNAFSVGRRLIVCTVQIRQKELLDVCKEFSKYNPQLKAAVSYLYFCISSSNRFNNVFWGLAETIDNGNLDPLPQLLNNGKFDSGNLDDNENLMIWNLIIWKLAIDNL